VPPSVPELIERLGRVFGEMQWRPSGDPVGELVLTILSQHTSDRLSGRAFANLLAQFPSWEAVLQAPTSEVAECIAGGGLSNQKAPRIKAVLERIHSERGSLDLHFLSGLPLDEARTWLVDLPGVGPKTAACVLMFALGKPALPVDTHVYRVGQRLGLIPPKMTADKAHAHLESIVPPADVYAFHVGLIKHGRYTCVAQRPRCDGCVLSDVCPACFSFKSSGTG